MKRYSSYKNSGIEWIGDIPMDWKAIRLKYLMRNFDGKRIPLSADERSEMQGDYPYYGSNGIVDRVNDYLFDGEYILLGEDGSPFFESYKDVAFLVSGKFWVNNHAHILKALQNYNQRFLTYSLNCVDYRKHITGSTRDKLTQDDMVNIMLPVAGEPEQSVLADYLDRKTTKIDDLIAKKERMVELLKEERIAIVNHAVTKGIAPDVEMKESGIKWLGKVPKHWEIKRLKYRSKKIGSGVTPKGGASVYHFKGILFLRSQNIHFDGLRLDDVAYISKDIHGDMSGSMVLRGDVLLNITGASIGRCCYYPENLGEANVNQHVCIIRPDKGSVTKYITYCLSSEVGQQQINNAQSGISREGLNFEELKAFIIPIPDFDEQINIVDYLDEKIGQINDQIQREKKSIELLKEYRTALISEVVTGKIDIRGT